MTTKLIDSLYDLTKFRHRPLDLKRVRIAEMFAPFLDDAGVMAIAGIPMIAGGATNELFVDGWKLAVVCTDGGALSGAPGRYGTLTGVALADKRTDNLTPMDFGPTVWNLSVKGANDAGNVAVAAGDLLFYVDADTPKISKKQSGYLFGVALAAVNSGATTTIAVAHVMMPLGASAMPGLALPGVAGFSALRVAQATWDFTVDGGGAPGLITPAANVIIPINTNIVGGIMNVITVPVGPTNMSVGLSAGGAGAAALIASAAISGAPWSTTGPKALVPVWTGASTIKMSAAGTVTFTTTVAAATAGKADILMQTMIGSG
jgi:hypothetical protein